MTAVTAKPTPQQLERTYRASARIVAVSRDVIARQADAWGLPASVKDPVIRSVSELVTNALAVSGASDHIRIRFMHTTGAVLICVWDRSAEEPKSMAPMLTLEDLDEMPDTAGPDELPTFGGWGLPLVESLADETGAFWENPAPHKGKWVWAKFNL